jgi:hypothetical protein
MPKPARKRAKRNAVPYQLREWSRRAEIVKKVLRMLRAGRSLNDASKQLGEPLANLSRYLCGFRKLGMAGLVPSLSTGRKPNAALTDAEAAEIAALSFRVVRREDIAAGCRAYAARPDCRPALQTVLAGRIPNSVRAAVRTHFPATEQ